MRGYSLIECLVAISLLGLVSAASARITQQTSAQLSGIARAVDQRLAIMKSVAVITATVNTAERTRLRELLTISDSSTLKATHGGPHPLIGIGASSKPRPLNSIISTIEVDPLLQGRIVETRPSTSGPQVTVCGTSSAPPAERFRSHLLLGMGGVCQVTGIPRPISQGCFTLAGTPTRGLLHSTPSCPAGSYHEYLPVAREFSVFVDRTGEFRLVSHVGMKLLENQPLARGLRELNATWIVGGHNATFMKLALRGAMSRELTFALPIPLRRSSLWNEILL
jgi:prepilin-type N-terminal cleavage/methylation domain-containing protein